MKTNSFASLPMFLRKELESLLKMREKSLMREALFKQQANIGPASGPTKNMPLTLSSTQPSVGKEDGPGKQFKDSGSTNDGSFEAIYDNDKPRFVLKKGQDFQIVESVQVDGIIYYPKKREHIPYEPYGFHQGSVSPLPELLAKCAKEYATFVVADQITICILAIFTALTYCQEKFQTVPYLALIGDNESGKSTVLQLMNKLCYRPLYGVTIPAADVYGYLKDSDGIPTILEDEVQGIERDFDKIKIYKAGYKKGAVVPKTLITHNVRIIEYYPTFCEKAFASERIPRVRGFQERLIPVLMVQGEPQTEWVDITRVDLDRLSSLRNELLKWKMETKNQDLPQIDLKIKGRPRELWKPFFQITYGLPIYDVLLKFVEDQAKERLRDKQDTLEGYLVKVVIDIMDSLQDPTAPIPFLNIWENLLKILNARLDNRSPHVMHTEEFGRLTKNKVGYRLREVLCGKSVTIREKAPFGNDLIVKAHTFDVDKVRCVAKKYGYELVTKLPTSPSSGGAQTP